MSADMSICLRQKETSVYICFDFSICHNILCIACLQCSYSALNLKLIVSKSEQKCHFYLKHESNSPTF